MSTIIHQIVKILSVVRVRVLNVDNDTTHADIVSDADCMMLSATWAVDDTMKMNTKRPMVRVHHSKISS